MSRLRVTVRRMMALVALVAIAIGLWGTLVRARHFRELAAEHARMERLREVEVARLDEAVRKDEAWYAAWKKRGGTKEELSRYVARQGEDIAGVSYADYRSLLLGLRETFHQEAAEERKLRIKYERAARRPWLLVEPDPAEPERFAGDGFH